MSGLPWLTFGDLKPGDRFRFHYNAARPQEAPYLSAEVYEKLRTGWYEDTTGVRSRTDSMSPVVLVDRLPIRRRGR
jgi:hypothetical protein